MITFDEFKKILTKEELEEFSDLELERMYEIATTFADFAYKDWIEHRDQKEEIVVE